MDFRQLETFIKVVELKSFTKAAEAVCLTQPTVSKQIVELERSLDVKLIDRTKRSVVLTRAGEIFFSYAKSFLNLRKETLDAIAAFKGVKTGKLIVGASTIPGIYVLPKILSNFKKQYDGIDIRLVISDTKDVVQKMRDEDIDVGFVGAMSDDSEIDYRKFIDDTIVFIAPPDYAGSIDREELKNYPLIARESGSGTRNNFEAALAKIRNLSLADFNVSAELTDTQAIKEAVKNGMGISYISRMAIVDELSSHKLKILSVEGFPEIRRSFYIITRRKRTMLPQVKALLKIIEIWRKNEKM
ncbi:MAG TPA: selenium metabolism-associated LysR family transcriptional regulator [Syntrophorhabdaceae bacterium]|nr:selenium metabolism-associated LysR family transcriptional regulator [Syntrophorhabdaceae bacterium]